MEKYIGIADAHGLESFFSMTGHENRLGFLVLRAGANRHRHALVYQVELTPDQSDSIKQMMENGKYILACRALHDPAFLQNALVGVETSMIDSWEMIPNPRLDLTMVALSRTQKKNKHSSMGSSIDWLMHPSYRGLS